MQLVGCLQRRTLKYGIHRLVRLKISMANDTNLNSKVVYSGKALPAYWEGRLVEDSQKFANYMREVVKPRLSDMESNFDSEIRNLATTGMDTQYVESLLGAVPQQKGWEVGEVFAECALRDDSGRRICWPWNMIRDRRTPRASLPGADLVGFWIRNEAVLLLIGEVKTSSDTDTPPGVMNGRSGMAWQLQNNATDLHILKALLQWLQARCKEQPYRNLYQQAVSRYLDSEGADIYLTGILIRDTKPSELDLQAKGNALSVQLNGVTRIELFAWYVPVPINDLPSFLQDLA